ncbi:HEAT repeat domain-containing protein [Myxococcota bacterium]|nr:HEAT repeat domain-containing protein [Myxococcota bacterium]
MSAGLRVVVFGLALAGAGLALSTSIVLAGGNGPYARLIASIREDDSFKVRAQAIRVLMKQVEASKTAPGDDVLAALSDAVAQDEDHVVRGLACFALSKLRDPRAVPALERAKSDAHPFVRAQADEALKVLAATKPAEVVRPVKVAGPRALVLGVEPIPGVATSAELDGALLGSLRAELSGVVGERFVLADAEGARGYRLAGSIAERKTEVASSGANKVTIGVRITLSTVPENHLRGVTTAKASAEVKGAASAGVEAKVLKAAVGRAVKDTLAQLEAAIAGE